MKKTSFIVWICVCWLSSLTCPATTHTLAPNENNKVVKGSGEVISEQRPVAAFSKIYASNGIDVFIEPGSSSNLKVSADDNLLQYIRTEVSDGTLRVSLQDGIQIRNARQMNVYVKMEQIENLKATSGADIKGTTLLTVGDISLTATSAGDIEMELAARHIQASATSGADMTLKGQAESLKASLTSGADLTATALKVKVGDISLSSGSDADVYVEESISYSVTSGADLVCYGNPKVTKANVNSGGDVTFK